VRLEFDEFGELAGDRVEAGERRIAARCSARFPWAARAARGHVTEHGSVSSMAFVGGP
jgi:hypothetical protein